MASTHLKKVGTRPYLPLCGIPSSFYNSLQTSGDWGDKLLKFRNRNVNLDLLTLAHENFHLNTLYLEKVQGKSLGCIKSRGETSPCVLYTHATGSHRKGMKEAREPWVADPWSMHYHQRVHSRSISRTRTRYKDCPKAQGEHIRHPGLLVEHWRTHIWSARTHTHIWSARTQTAASTLREY